MDPRRTPRGFESRGAALLRNDSAHHTDILTDGTVWVLARSGVDAYDMAALARWAKVSRQAIARRWSRAEVVEMVVERFEQRWLAWSCRDRDRLPLALPRDHDERLGVRVRDAVVELALGEEAAGRPAAAAAVRATEARELEHVQRALPGGTMQELAAVVALTAGLRRVLSLTPELLAPADAEDVLLRAIRRGAEPDGGTDPAREPSGDDGRGPLHDRAQVAAVEGPEDSVVRRPQA